MKTISLILLLVGFSLQLNAQSGKLKKADGHYVNIAYAEAALLYGELIGTEVDSPTLKAKLGDCYYQMGDAQNAAKYYSEMIDSPEASTNDVYNYAQALKENGNYKESDVWMEKFNSMNNSDTRGVEYSMNKDYISQIESQEAYFSISHLSMNTSASEFGGYLKMEKFIS